MEATRFLVLAHLILFVGHSVIIFSFVAEKQHLRHALLFLFHQQEKTAESRRLLVETYAERASWW